MKNNPWQMILLILALIGFPGACTFIPAGVSSTPTPLIPSPAITQTITPSATPTLTPTPTLSPTPTFLPTLLPVELQERIQSLIKTNGGCRLPCYWGIVPGVTRIQEAKKILEPLTSHTVSNENYITANIFIFPEGVTSYDFFSLSFQGTGNIIQQTMISGLNQVDQYSIPKFLASYGKPDNIWILTNHPTPGLMTDFVLIAFYGKQGLIAYWQGTGTTQGLLIHGCINGSPELYLWPPSSDITKITDTSKYFDPILSGGERTLEEASGMDVETFYERFNGVDGPVCVDTPLDLWCDVYSCGYPSSPTP